MIKKLSETHVKIIQRISEVEDQADSRLGKLTPFIGVTQNTVATACAYLAARGYLRKHPDPRGAMYTLRSPAWKLISCG